jgi:putative ABC transport system ATP-binding protein
VAIARAIAKRPDVLRATSRPGAGRHHWRGRARSDLENQAGTSTVVITHNAAIAGLADRVVRL